MYGIEIQPKTPLFYHSGQWDNVDHYWFQSFFLSLTTKFSSFLNGRFYICAFLFYTKKAYRISFLCAHMLPFLCILFILISYEYGRVEKFFFSPKTSHTFHYKPPFLSEKNHFSGLHPSHSTSLCFTLTDNILLAFGYPINW